MRLDVARRRAHVEGARLHRHQLGVLSAERRWRRRLGARLGCSGRLAQLRWGLSWRRGPGGSCGGNGSSGSAGGRGGGFGLRIDVRGMGVVSQGDDLLQRLASRCDLERERLLLLEPRGGGCCGVPCLCGSEGSGRGRRPGRERQVGARGGGRAARRLLPRLGGGAALPQGLWLWRRLGHRLFLFAVGTAAAHVSLVHSGFQGREELLEV